MRRNVSRMTVTLKADQQKGIDPTDLKTLTDYFHNAMVKALEPQMPVVEKAGPGVIAIRIALTDLVPTEVFRSLTGTLVPYGFVAEAGSGVAMGRPAGSTPYLGETGMEIQFIDGASGAVVAECRDTQIGRKYAADLNSGTAGAAQTWANGYELLPGLGVRQKCLRQVVRADSQAPGRTERRGAGAVAGFLGASLY